jgi:hypothetical protein
LLGAIFHCGAFPVFRALFRPVLTFGHANRAVVFNRPRCISAALAFGRAAQIAMLIFAFNRWA